MNEITSEILASALTFIALWFALGHLIFKPFFKLLEEREARTTGDEHLAQEKRNRTKVLEQQIEEKIREARLAGISNRDERVRVAKSRAQEIIDIAVKQASDELEKAEKQIGDLKEQALKELAQEAENLSGVVASRALASGTSHTIH